MKSKTRLLIYALVILFFAACKEPFEPAIDTPLTGYLVVEGNITSGIGTTVIKLSRSGVLDRGPRVETQAEVHIVGEDLSTYRLTGDEQGVYKSANLNLPKQRYRLRIKAGGKEYLSDLLEERPTPPIDSVSWERNQDGVKILVHTHDDENKTKYYKWTFEETWEVQAKLFANYKYKRTVEPNQRVVTTLVRTNLQEKQLFKYCWSFENSTNILVGSTAKQAKDIITLPLKLIENDDERLYFLYSIKVMQIALDAKSYNFYKKIQANTENNGSIFDRQPSELSGNIKCVSHPEESVIGNVLLTTPQEKRIFIPSPPNWSTGVECNAENKTMFYDDDTFVKYIQMYRSLGRDVVAEKTPFQSDTLALYAAYIPFEPVINTDRFDPIRANHIMGYTLVKKSCVDCTDQDASNIKPSFWPN